MTNVHLEALTINHPLADRAPRLASLVCAPWAAENMNTICRQLRRTPPDKRAIILPFAGQMVTHQPADHIVSTDPQPIVHPNAEEHAKAWVRGYYHTGDLVGVLERMARPLRQSGIIDTIGLIWIDAEHLWTGSASEADYPGLRALIPQVFPGVAIPEIERLGRVAMFNGLRRAVEFVGFNPDALCVFACADRVTQPWPAWAPVPALGVPVPRPHIICTDPHPQVTDTLRATLRAASGAENCVVHLTTAVPAYTNKVRLTICREEGVGDVILFSEKGMPGVDYPTPAARELAEKRLLNESMAAFA